MNSFKNNYRRGRYKSNGDRNFRKRNGNGHKANGEYNNNSEFKRRNPGKNNQNAAKLVDKYNDLAREALSNGDKILSENYLQHADHFSRITSHQEILKEAESNSNKTETITVEKKEDSKQIKDENTINHLNKTD